MPHRSCTSPGITRLVEPAAQRGLQIGLLLIQIASGEKEASLKLFKNIDCWYLHSKQGARSNDMPMFCFSLLFPRHPAAARCPSPPRPRGWAQPPAQGSPPALHSLRAAVPPVYKPTGALKNLQGPSSPSLRGFPCGEVRVWVEKSRFQVPAQAVQDRHQPNTGNPGSSPGQTFNFNLTG